MHGTLPTARIKLLFSTFESYKYENQEQNPIYTCENHFHQEIKI